MISEQNDNGNGVKNERVRKIIFNELSFLVAIMGVVIGVVLFITRPDAELKQEIALLKQEIHTIRFNDLEHLRQIIGKCDTSIIDNTESINEINYKLVRIMTKLEIE